jgi:hypothetical protein
MREIAGHMGINFRDTEETGWRICLLASRLQQRGSMLFLIYAPDRVLLLYKKGEVY